VIPAGDDTHVRPVQPSVWNIANALTILRIVLVPFFGYFLLYDGGQLTSYRLLAAAVFVVATATDRMDGDIARARGLVTDFGKVSDPIADKALMGMALVGLSIIELLPWWVTVVVLVREVGVTILRFMVIRHGVMPASRGGKLKTALQAVAILLYILPLNSPFTEIAAVVMTLAVIVTVVTGADYVMRAQTLRKTSPRAQLKRERSAAAALEKATAEPAARDAAARGVAASEAATRKAAARAAARIPAAPEEAGDSATRGLAAGDSATRGPAAGDSATRGPAAGDSAARGEAAEERAAGDAAARGAAADDRAGRDMAAGDPAGRNGSAAGQATRPEA
jgi:CDP-diacylglycerol--glycerol-3-phosphate 3-phosphatidyltransferase